MSFDKLYPGYLVHMPRCILVSISLHGGVACTMYLGKVFMMLNNKRS